VVAKEHKEVSGVDKQKQHAGDQWSVYNRNLGDCIPHMNK